MTKINWALQPVCAWCGLESVNKAGAIEHAQNCDKSPLVRRILALDTIIKMCDEALDEFGAGYCSANSSAKPEDVVKAVIEAMVTLRGRINYKD